MKIFLLSLLVRWFKTTKPEPIRPDPPTVRPSFVNRGGEIVYGGGRGDDEFTTFTEIVP
jgi:hypothetical protein